MSGEAKSPNAPNDVYGKTTVLRLSKKLTFQKHVWHFSCSTSGLLQHPFFPFFVRLSPYNCCPILWTDIQKFYFWHSACSLSLPVPVHTLTEFVWGYLTGIISAVRVCRGQGSFVLCFQHQVSFLLRVSIIWTNIMGYRAPSCLSISITDNDRVDVPSWESPCIQVVLLLCVSWWHVFLHFGCIGLVKDLCLIQRHLWNLSPWSLSPTQLSQGKKSAVNCYRHVLARCEAFQLLHILW